MAKRIATRKKEWDDNEPIQIKRFLDDDGIEKERHEYQGPHGSGYISYEYKTVDGVKMVSALHVGDDPSFASHTWRKIPKDNINGS